MTTRFLGLRFGLGIRTICMQYQDNNGRDETSIRAYNVSEHYTGNLTKPCEYYQARVSSLHCTADSNVADAGSNIHNQSAV
jgi:hypothetical protein